MGLGDSMPRLGLAFVLCGLALLLFVVLSPDAEAAPSFAVRAVERRAWRALRGDSLLLYSSLYASEAEVAGVGVQRCGKLPWRLTLRISTPASKDRYIKGTTQSLETSCPFHVAPKCEWSPHMVTFKLPPHFKIKPDSRFSIVKADDVSVELWPPFVQPASPPLKPRLAVCVPPLYLYADWLQLLQFVEFWTQRLGADKIFVYSTSMSSKMGVWLEGYARAGLVEVVPWPLLPSSADVDPNSSFYRVGLVGALNDCLLRTTGVFKYAAMVDLDEYVVPSSGAQPLGPWLDSLGQEATAAAFVFQHAVTNYPPDYHLPANLSLTGHQDFTYFAKLKFDNRLVKNAKTKFVVRPERVRTVSVHVPNRYRDGFVRHYVAASAGRLYHLRRYPRGPSADAVLAVPPALPQAAPLLATALHTRAAAFFPGQTDLDSDADVLVAVTHCLTKWKESGCKVPHEMCEELLRQRAGDWTLFNSSAPGTNPRFLVL